MGLTTSSETNHTALKSTHELVVSTFDEKIWDLKSFDVLVSTTDTYPYRIETPYRWQYTAVTNHTKTKLFFAVKKDANIFVHEISLLLLPKLGTSKTDIQNIKHDQHLQYKYKHTMKKFINDDSIPMHDTYRNKVNTVYNCSCLYILGSGQMTP